MVPDAPRATAPAEAEAVTPERVGREPLGGPPLASTAQGIKAIICAYSWDCATAMRIVDCETGGTFDPYANGHEDERGWFQIRFNHWDKLQCNPEYLYNPAYNTACAYSIWLESGWGPWSCW